MRNSARLVQCLAPFLLMACETSDEPDTDDAGETDGTVDTDDTDGGDLGCVPEADLEAIGAHIDDLGQSGALLLGHGGPTESVSAFLFPGYPALVAQYATLVEACTAAFEFEEWCDGQLCWQLECTGVGASHTTHGRLASPPLTTAGGYTFEAATTAVSWIESTNEVVATLNSISISPEGTDLSIEGTSTLRPEGAVEVTETYSGLVDGGAVLTATLDLEGTTITGQLAAGPIVVAEFDGHDLVATGDCP